MERPARIGTGHPALQHERALGGDEIGVKAMGFDEVPLQQRDRPPVVLQMADEALDPGEITQGLQ